MMTEALALALKNRQAWMAALGGQGCYFCDQGDAARGRA